MQGPPRDNRISHERRKERISYTYDMFSFDLTKVEMVSKKKKTLPYLTTTYHFSYHILLHISRSSKATTTAATSHTLHNTPIHHTPLAHSLTSWYTQSLRPPHMVCTRFSLHTTFTFSHASAHTAQTLRHTPHQQKRKRKIVHVHNAVTCWSQQYTNHYFLLTL